MFQFTRRSKLQTRRRRQVLGRILQLQKLEVRSVLSGISLVDFAPTAHDTDGDHHVDIAGNEYHSLPLPVGNFDASASAPDGSSPADAISLSDTFLLHSNPGAEHTIFLDFDSHVTSGTIWNSSFNGGADIVTPAYNFTGDATFADSELTRIQAIWQRVAEDFIPFDVNVTTEQPSADALIKSGSGDSEWGVRVVVGGNSSWYGSAGGVAYIGSFNWSSDTPVFVFEDNLGNGNEKYTAEAISHEAGHALGLNHDGRISPSETYYAGHGSGATGWAPIMGNSYYKQLTQWSRGEYASASSTQDDLAIITGNNGFGYRADDHGDGLSSAASLDVSQNTVSGQGIIERNDDVDVFTFLTDAGSVNLDFLPFERGPNLDIAAALFDAAGSLITSSNPVGSLGASISLSLAAGQYFVQVSGGGEGDPASTGYSDYGSLGSYTITGSIVATDADYLSIGALDADRSEGDASSTAFTFTVTRSGNTSGSTSVSWSVSGGTAVDGSDFVGGQLPNGTVDFAAGETSKQITVSVNGDIDWEADEAFTVALSGATSGTLITTSAADGTIRNDDSAPTPPGFTVTPVSGLTTSEAGGSATFSVVLDTAPQADVTVGIQSSDTTEGIANKSSLVFTASNWNVPQIVTVTGVDDSVRDRNVQYVIQVGAAQSNDATYNGLNPDDVQVTNQDNEKGKGGGGGGGNKGGGKGGGKKGPKNGLAVNTVEQGAVRIATTNRDSRRAADGLSAHQRENEFWNSLTEATQAVDAVIADFGNATDHAAKSEANATDWRLADDRSTAEAGATQTEALAPGLVDQALS